MIILWIKAFHLVAMVAWFAGLFYLPRLYVYHAMAKDTLSLERFKIMERKLYYGIMAPAAIITLSLGIALLSIDFSAYMHMGWMHTKLSLVFLLILFHLYCGQLRKDFRDNKNKHTHSFYRWLNEAPTVLLIAIVILVVVKPF